MINFLNAIMNVISVRHANYGRHSAFAQRPGKPFGAA
jgi:hypothetical protein